MSKAVSSKRKLGGVFALFVLICGAISVWGVLAPEVMAGAKAITGFALTTLRWLFLMFCTSFVSSYEPAWSSSARRGLGPGTNSRHGHRDPFAVHTLMRLLLDQQLRWLAWRSIGVRRQSITVCCQ